jgi:hypothetical protein
MKGKSVLLLEFALVGDQFLESPLTISVSVLASNIQ